MIASLFSTLRHKRMSGSAAIPAVPSDAQSLIMLVAAIVALVVGMAVVKGILGVVTRLVEIAIAIGGTVMVLGLLGFVGVGAYLMSVLKVGPFQ